MIKRAPLGSDEVKVTFAVPSTVGKVSVIGDFNGWSPLATPMKPRSNGTRSAAVVLPAGPHLPVPLPRRGRPVLRRRRLRRP